MSVRIDKGRAASEMNMTPLIDVVFQLILFFLLASSFVEEERSLAVTLPQASEARPLTMRPRELIVNIDADGNYFVSTQKITAPQVLQVLIQAHTNNPGRQTVLIRADKRCRWQAVVTVMDLCNKANIRDYRVATAEPL
jgi:biopolymer transport protein ExbD